MNFLILSHIFPPAIDGGSSHLYQLGRCLKNHGHQIFYFSSNCYSTDDFVTRDSPSSETSLRSASWRRSNPRGQDRHASLAITLKLPVYKNMRRPLKFINPIFAKGPIFKILPFLKALLTIRKFHPDYIIAGPFPTTISLYAHLLQKITHTKLVIVPCFHPNDILFSHPSLIKTLHASNHILTLTDFEKKYLASHFNLNPHKIHLIPSGVSASLLKTTPAVFPKIPQLLYIGSFSAHKGLDILIKSLPPNCQLTLAGQKTLYWPQIQNLIKNHQNIHPVFNFPSAKLPQLLDACTCLILPSNQESFGKVILEAWARKKPVIVKNIPAPAGLVRASHGGLIFTNNPQKQILNLINHPQLARRLGQNGYQFVQNNYTWSKIGKSLCQKLSL